MKVSLLLNEFLYENRSLSLLGIGRFFIDPAVAILPADDKNYFEFLAQIQFEQKSVTKHDDVLIDYIRTHTGKIKPLAEADLDSFLDDCKSLLNIGKPLHLDGIGTLQKVKNGILEFTPGSITSERIEHHSNEKPVERGSERKMIYPGELSSMSQDNTMLKRILIIGGILFGLAVVIWGGYLLYSKNTSEVVQESTPVNTSNNTPETTESADTNKNTSTQDTLSLKPVDTLLNKTPGSDGMVNYKFILQISNSKALALNNYTKAKAGWPDLQMETKDSVTFKIYRMYRCLPADTTLELQKMNSWYWGRKEMRVKIEY